MPVPPYLAPTWEYAAGGALLLALAKTAAPHLWKGAQLGGQRVLTFVRRPARVEHMLAQLVVDVGTIQAEMNPNGGGTVRDAINRIERHIAFEITTRRATEHRGVWEGLVIEGRVEPAAVSYLWTRITGQSADDTRDGGWLLAIHPDDRDRVQQAFRDATERGHVSQADYRAVNVHTGVETKVRHHIHPTKVRGQIVGWTGELVPMYEALR